MSVSNRARLPLTSSTSDTRQSDVGPRSTTSVPCTVGQPFGYHVNLAVVHHPRSDTDADTRRRHTASSRLRSRLRRQNFRQICAHLVRPQHVQQRCADQRFCTINVAYGIAESSVSNCVARRARRAGSLIDCGRRYPARKRTLSRSTGGCSLAISNRHPRDSTSFCTHANVSATLVSLTVRTASRLPAQGSRR